MKKILSFILAALMTASCAAYVAADDAAVDTAANEQAAFQEAAVEFLKAKNIFKGYTDGEGHAEDDIQRYQMALFVARMSTGWTDDDVWEDGVTNSSTFTDINEGAAADFKGALSYANQNGIIEGYDAEHFGPYDGIRYKDALTMVVRTLGYKGLSYEWGYIQKAVELGLTNKIDATYEQNLTRGQVAIIIYNALFAEMKSGETLAKSIFGVDFGWETIVITATDEAGFNNNGIRANDGYVGFNIIDENGNIGTKTYYVDKKELGLENDHDDELAVGYIYDALFEVDGDLATMITAYAHDYDVYSNNGITDNEGKAVEAMPIKALLDKYSLVKERVGKEYLTFNGKELYIYEQGVYTYYVDAAEDAKIVGIDVNNNIVKWDFTDNEWDIAWYYNATLDRYYRYYLENDKVLVDWMSDSEFTEWYNTASKIAKTESQYVLKTALATATDTAYAKLVASNLNDNDAYEMALYKEYAIGYFKNDSKKCGINANGVNHNNDVKHPSYNISTLDGLNVLNVLVEKGHEVHDPNCYKNIAAGEGFAWFNVADDVTGFENEDGSYNNGYVVYNWNKLTGEIEVVKYIPESGKGMDEDSYVVTGVLQGFSTANRKLTVNGTSYEYGYDKLLGVSSYLKKGNADWADRQISGNYLDPMLMQYVKLLVVDNMVVDIDTVGESRDIIVVYGYAGITSDAYIAVYGYSTKDAALNIYKINSYNGWKQGDYRYYPNNADADKAFEEGTVYAIKSWDSETNSYGVETLAVVDEFATKAEKTIVIDNGYRVYGDSVEKVADSDCYIIIRVNDEGNYVDIYCVSGSQLPTTDLELKGKELYKDGGKIVLAVNENDIDATKGTPFFKNANDVGFILYDKNFGSVLEAAYDDAIGDWYLLGSTASEVRVWDLLSGTHKYVFKATNIDLKDGYVYKTIGNTVVAAVDLKDAGNEYVDFVKAIADYYQWTKNSEYAKYMVAEDGNNAIKTVTVKLTDNGVKIGDKDIKIAIADLFGMFTSTDAKIQAKIADANIKEVRYLKVTNGKTTSAKSIEELALVKGVEYNGNVVYNVAGKTAIVYIYAEAINYGQVTEAIDLSKLTVDPVAQWEYSAEDDTIEAELTAGVALEAIYDKVGDTKTLNGIKLDTITVKYDTKLKNMTHDDILKAGYVFGILEDHDNESAFFFFEDSQVTKNGKAVANANDMTFSTLDATCDGVNQIVIKVGDVLELLACGGTWEYTVSIVAEDGVVNEFTLHIEVNDRDGDGKIEVENEEVVIKVVAGTVITTGTAKHAAKADAGIEIEG